MNDDLPAVRGPRDNLENTPKFYVYNIFKVVVFYPRVWLASYILQHRGQKKNMMLLLSSLVCP